ncbi:telomeric repeat-binding factor 1 isoform X4 [Cricetulus griseus]|uniref:telomeric repeat-binding factor 1 isoform X4 n=1 Tax=Cricetulus griseus TaxID=10029 RepID=UPI0015C32E69|nr:telomeric repeat-binding factor 1 isoform X4 [Cricetulus griseus]
MAAAVASEARNSRACANRKDADSPEEEMKEPPGDDAELVAEAEAVAAGWMLDFLCLSLCRAFRDGRSEDFRRTRDSAEAIIHGLPSLTAYQLRTVYICQFLTRIAAGKSLDAQFESDERITPLESALMIWDSIQKEHDKLNKEIRDLIKIQAVAVCMESGSFKEAEEVFERIFCDPESHTSLGRKLLRIISQKDPYHSFFQHFSYNFMMEKIKSYVDCVLNEKSSTFLMKAATKVVENEKAGTLASKNKQNATNTETETEVNLNKGRRGHAYAGKTLMHIEVNNSLNQKMRKEGCFCRFAVLFSVLSSSFPGLLPYVLFKIRSYFPFKDILPQRSPV